jgi:aminoglycoside phosphotransferase (APT) family kinase protein
MLSLLTMQEPNLPLPDIVGEPAILLASDEALLAQLARRTLGAKAELAGYRIIKQQPDYLVLVARFVHPAILVTVKLAGPRASLPCPFDRTAALLRIVRANTSVPVPEVLAANVDYGEWPWRYMIKTYVPGQEWAVVRQQISRQDLSNAHRQIGQAVAELHTIRFPGFGELSSEGTAEQGEAYTPALTERARRRIPEPRRAELFIAMLRDRAHLFGDVSQASLCHEDLHGHNIIFATDQGRPRLAAILDFDSAWAGHHESDLARLELWHGMTGEGFWEAYKEIRQVAETYPHRRLIHQLMWCLEYNSTTPEHIADTRRVCEALGLSPGDFA